jgi:hypothetical protein
VEELVLFFLAVLVVADHVWDEFVGNLAAVPKVHPSF